MIPSLPPSSWSHAPRRQARATFLFLFCARPVRHLVSQLLRLASKLDLRSLFDLLFDSLIEKFLVSLSLSSCSVSSLSTTRLQHRFLCTTSIAYFDDKWEIPLILYKHHCLQLYCSSTRCYTCTVQTLHWTHTEKPFFVFFFTVPRTIHIWDRLPHDLTSISNISLVRSALTSIDLQAFMNGRALTALRPQAIRRELNSLF